MELNTKRGRKSELEVKPSPPSLLPASGVWLLQPEPGGLEASGAASQSVPSPQHSPEKLCPQQYTIVMYLTNACILLFNIH